MFHRKADGSQPKKSKGKKKVVAKKPRRARGSGVIFFDVRRDQWVGRVPAGKLSGGRTRYREVRAPAQATVVQLMTQVKPPAPDVTIREWVERWLAGLTNRPSTCATYAHSMNKHIVPELGHIRVAELTVSQVKAAAAAWRGLKPQTINLTLDRGTTMFAAAIVDGLAAANPFRLCPRREYQRAPIDPFSRTELKAIIAAWESGACGPLFAFLAATGT